MVMGRLRDQREVPVELRRDDVGGGYHVIVDDIYHYYTGDTVDMIYLEYCLEDAGYHYRQSLDILRRLERLRDDADETD